MTLSLLPLYLLGNLHCAGMCGPLVMMLARHRYRMLYFVGRLFSFSFAGLLCAELGQVLDLMLRHYQIPAVTSLLFGGMILLFGLLALFRLPYPGQRWLAARTSGLSLKLSQLMGNDHPMATFLFGVCTVLLPCGQTLVVFSACALMGNPLEGLLNGFLFALLTSPSLFLAMTASHFLTRKFAWLLPLAMLLVGTLALCRGFAELQLIPHCVIDDRVHLVLY